MYTSTAMMGRERENENEGERTENKPLYRWGKVSSSYHINLHALSADPLEMTVQKKNVMNLPLKMS